MIAIFLTPITKNSSFIKNNIVHKYFDYAIKIISMNKENSFKQNLMETRYLNQGVFSYEILKNNIFFGVGNKNYFKACRKHVDGYEKNLCFTHPHQIYYELMSEHGVIGSFLIIFCIFYLVFFNQKKDLNNNIKKKLIIFRIYLILSLLPLIPSGSFFSSFISALFWINYALYTIYRNKLISVEYEKN